MVCQVADQLQFLLSAEFFDGCLAATGAAAVWVLFLIHNLLGGAAMKKTSAALMRLMLFEASLQVGGNACIKMSVGGLDDIESPVSFCHKNRVLAN